MKKPVAEIERMRDWTVTVEQYDQRETILAYLDSIPDDADWHGKWPRNLDKEQLEMLAASFDRAGSSSAHRQALRDEALLSLAAIAPEKPKKRRVELYAFEGLGDERTRFGDIVVFNTSGPVPNAFPWRKVGECEIEE